MQRPDSIARIRLKLQSCRPSLGSWIQIPHSSIAEILGGSNYDWVAVDMEHGAISVNQLPDLCRALELRGTLPLVRVAEASPQNVKSALDSGAGGVILPMIESDQHLVDIIHYSCWPPSGKRGVGFSRANLFGNEFKNYAQEAQHPLVIAMVESTNALDNLNDICRVPGLDAIMVGPYDLSASLGVTGQLTHPDYLTALGMIKRAAKAAGMPLGLHVVEPNPRHLEEVISEGFLFCAYGLDAVFLLRAAVAPVVATNTIESASL